MTLMNLYEWNFVPFLEYNLLLLNMFQNVKWWFQREIFLNQTFRNIPKNFDPLCQIFLNPSQNFRLGFSSIMLLVLKFKFRCW